MIGCLALLPARARADAASDAAAAQDRGLPLAAVFHAARAQRTGADVAIPRVDVDALWRDLPTRPKIALSESCAWMRPRLEEIFQPSIANVTVDAALTCERAENTWTERQDYVWYTTQERTETRTVPGEQVYQSQMCQAATSADWSTCGQWVTGPDRTEEVVVVDEIPHDGTREVERRAVRAVARGTITGPSGSTTVDFDRDADELQFSDEHGSQAYSTSLADLQEDATLEVGRGVLALLEPVTEAQRQRELEAAAGAGDALARDEHWLRAWTLGDPGTALAEAYGLTEQDVADLLAGAGVDVPFALEVRLFQQRHDAAEERRWAPKPGPSVFRLFATAQLTVDRTTRVGGGQTSLGVGARVELGWRLPRKLGWAPGVIAGAGKDDLHGSHYEVRAGLALGVRSRRHQLIYLAGIGYAGAGVPMPLAASTLEAAPDFFHGLDLRLGGPFFALDARLLQLKGGVLGDEGRLTLQALATVGKWVVGLEGSVRQLDDDVDTTITALGLTFGLDRARDADRR